MPDKTDPLPTVQETIDAFAAYLLQGHKGNIIKFEDIVSGNKEDFPLYHVYNGLAHCNGFKNGKPILKICIPKSPAQGAEVRALSQQLLPDNKMFDGERVFSSEEYEATLAAFTHVQKEMSPYFSIEFVEDIDDANIVACVAEPLEGVNFGAFDLGRGFGGERKRIIGISPYCIKLPTSSLSDKLLHEFCHSIGLEHVHDLSIQLDPEHVATINRWGEAKFHYLSQMYYDAQAWLGEEVNDLRMREMHEPYLGVLDRLQIEYGLYTARRDEYVDPRDFTTAFLAKEYSYIPLFNSEHTQDFLNKFDEWTRVDAYSADDISRNLEFLKANRRNYDVLLENIAQTRTGLYGMSASYHTILGVEKYDPQELMERMIYMCNKDDNSIDRTEKMILENLTDITGYQVEYKDGQVIIPNYREHRGIDGSYGKTVIPKTTFKFGQD